jgi:hypothetical protein
MKYTANKYNELPNHTPVAIEDVPIGCAFQKKPDANKIFDRDKYCREAKRYAINDHDDIWGDWQFLKKGKIVYTIDY